MPSLFELTDAYPQQPTGLPVEQPIPDNIPRVYINTAENSPQSTDNSGFWSNLGMAGVDDKSGTSESPIIKKLFGLGGEERYQLWPEKVVREAIAAPHDALNTNEPVTSQDLIAPAQAVSALAGTGGLAGADATLGSTAFLRPALKYENKIYKAPIGGQHLDALPAHLAEDFNTKAMTGEDINHYNFGFMNHKGQFLSREAALDYAVKEGLVDPSAGQYGALTSTLMADSSKPGTAIESLAKTWNVKGFEDHNWYHGTTHDFDKFSLAKGNIENHLGQYPHFSNSPKDVSANYAGYGPDLTGRIERRAEDIFSEATKDVDLKYNSPEYKTAMEKAKAEAAKEIAGLHEGAIIPAKLNMKNPADITPNGKTWIDFTAKTDKDGEWIKDNPNISKLLNSLKKQGEKYGFDGEKVFHELNEKVEGLGYDSIKAHDLDKALRSTDELQYAEHPKDGKIVASHVIANVFKDLGFDGIVMDAKSAFPHMKNIDEGTLHAVPLKRNTVQSKLTGQTLFADSSKPGTAIEAMAKTQPFYSALEHNVNAINQSKMTGDQWLGTLANKPGVKPEELDWTGIKSFLEERGKQPVTKEQLQEHLQNNKVELKEVDKGVNFRPELTEKDKVELANLEKRFVDKDMTLKLDDAERVAELRMMRDRLPTLDDKPTKYHSYQLPGGENYREKLLTLPDRKILPDGWTIKDENGMSRLLNEKGEQVTARSSRELLDDFIKNKSTIPPDRYKSSHWDEPNILAHVRMNDRMIDGKKSLHIEEIQSDWHQQGRDKGYNSKELDAKKKELLNKVEEAKQATKNVEKETWLKETNGKFNNQTDFVNNIVTDGSEKHVKAAQEFNRINEKVEENQKSYKEAYGQASRDFNELNNKSSGIPDAPFKKTWHELALKRMIREAAEKGYSRLSWTPGEAQAARYDLSKQIDRIQYHNDKQRLVAFDKNGSVKMDENIAPEKVSDYVGKEAAKKLFEAPKMLGTIHTLENADLKIGGEGMKGFYDQIVPKAVEKISGEKVKTYIPKKVEASQEEINKLAKTFYETYERKGGEPAWEKLHPDDQQIYKTNAKSKMYLANNPEHSVHYIDIPQSLKDKAMSKGFPLFSSTHMFTPVAGNPFDQK